MEVETDLPLTAKYFSEVIKHAQDTTTEVHSPSAADTKRLASDFSQRDSKGSDGDTSAAGRGSDDGRNSSGDAGAAKSIEGSPRQDSTKSDSGSNTAGGELGQLLFSKSVADAGTPPTPAERASSTVRVISKLPVGLRRPVRSLTTDIAHFATRGLQASASIHDLADWAAKHGMTAMKDLARMFSEKGSYKVELDRQISSTKLANCAKYESHPQSRDLIATS